MGQPYIYRRPLVKRNDYKIEEIEKKYTNQELTQLVLFDNLYAYPQRKYNPNKRCEDCLKNPMTKEFQLSEMKECFDCYIKRKKENYDYILKCIEEGDTIFEGDCILENKLYLGGIESSFLKDKLKEIGITHILMVGYFMTPLFPEDFTYENIEINDIKNENILQHLIKGLKFIEQSKMCYTHCQLGKSRSASFVIAYVMYKNKIHFSEAFNFVRSKRSFAFPNEGFQWQLEDFDIILSNFDYDLEKCDEFIKNYFKNKESLKETEKKFLYKKLAVRRASDDDDDNYNSNCESILDGLENLDEKYFEDEKKDENKEENENETKKDEIKSEENKENENEIKNENEEQQKIEEKKNEENNEKKETVLINSDKKEIEKPN